jgi:hypothetical protein
MGVDKSYGSGYNNTGKAKPLTVAQKRTAAVSARRVTGSAESPITKNMMLASDLRTGKANVAEPFGVDFGMAVLPFTRLGAAASRAAKLATRAGDTIAARSATAAAERFNLAAKFPKSSGAKSIESNIIKEVLKQRANPVFGGNPIRIPKALGIDDAYKYLKRRDIEDAHRGIAKILGKAGRIEPSLRYVGEEVRKVSGYRKYRGIVDRKAR